MGGAVGKVGGALKFGALKVWSFLKQLGRWLWLALLVLGLCCLCCCARLVGVA